MSDKPPLEELLDYPALFTFRVVASVRDDLEDEVRGIVLRILDRPVTKVSRRPSSKGAFLSVRVSVMVTCAAEIRSVYAALHEIEGLKMLL